MILEEAESLLDPVSDIEGFMLACLVDLAMARREIRAFCASFALGNQPGTISSASRTT